MTWVLYGVVFLIGMLVGIRWIASLFTWIDLWYDLKRYWPIPLKRTIVWSIIISILIWLFSPNYSLAFAAGVLAQAVVYWLYFLVFNQRLRAGSPHGEAARE